MKQLRNWVVCAGVVCAFGYVTACSSNDPTGSGGTGNIEFSIYGEDFIEKSIEAENFETGWTLTYEAFLVNLGDIKVADDAAGSAAEQSSFTIYNLKSPGPQTIVNFPSIEARRWDHVSYRIKIADADSKLGKDVTEEQKQALVGGGYSVWVKGKAEKAGVTKAFTWGFKKNTFYDKCEAAEDAGSSLGSVVTNGGTDSIQLTIHGDHLFYDDLQTPGEKLRFELIASADTNMDGDIEPNELAQISLSTVNTATYGPYGTGSASNINNLWDFLSAQTQTIGHFRGEGHCSSKSF
jgi:hypothetical protein